MVTVVRLREHEGAAAEEAEEQEHGVAHQREEHAVFGHAVGPLAVARAQGARQKRVDADRRAGGQTDHQILRRKAEGHRRERFFADHADKDAVHHVVKRLYQHGDHQRHRHVEYQFADGHDAHFVFCRTLHGYPSLPSHVARWGKIYASFIKPILTSFAAAVKHAGVKLPAPGGNTKFNTDIHRQRPCIRRPPVL